MSVLNNLKKNNEPYYVGYHRATEIRGYYVIWPSNRRSISCYCMIFSEYYVGYDLNRHNKPYTTSVKALTDLVCVTFVLKKMQFKIGFCP